MTSTYVIALGSNRRGRHGSPAAEVRAALAAIGNVVTESEIIQTAPMGAAVRRFANAVAVIESRESPPDLLDRLKAIETVFGRRSGQRWSDRVIDLDIILWSDGPWSSDGLTIPHAAFRTRRFVLDPLNQIVPDWRDPLTGLSVRQLAMRLTRTRLTRKRRGSGAGP
ncbi:MAG: 2-amino-4-hydroxy-6-hydroxymethyldihydropteridine diphosphokinase [Pseudomonadota bacterium]